jgi:hypothetical protein
MPILVNAPPESPLSQGDLLKGVSLYFTGDDWAESGGKANQHAKSALALVISRPCVLANKGNFTVALVEKFAVQITPDKDDVDAKRVRHLLEKLRDGTESPDCFYLGELPGQEEGRYRAKLDSLHSIKLPSSNLQPFLEQNRVATLSEDFLRDLHVRIFSTFSKLGFDDISWYSTKDLQWLTQAMRRDRAKKVLELETAKMDLEQARVGGNAKDKHKEGLDIRIGKLEKEIEDEDRELSNLTNELGRRT